MVILHCGWPRTGTTSLQTALARSREALAADGIVFPEKWISRLGPNHHGLSVLLRGHMANGTGFEELESFLVAQGDRDVVFSAEGLSLWTFSPERHEVLLGFLAEAARIMPVRCVWTMRRLDVVTNSLFSVGLKFRARRRGRGTSPAVERPVWEEDPPLWDNVFAGMLAVERAVGGDAAYVRYDPAGGHQMEVVEALGIDGRAQRQVGAELANGPRHNAALTHKGAIVLFELGALSARAGIELDGALLVDAFERGELRFEEDWQCWFLGAAEAERLRGQALAAARRHGARYADFFATTEEPCPPAIPPGWDQALISDGDLERLVAYQDESAAAAPAVR